MKYLRTLLATLLAVVSLAVFANDRDGVAVEEGTYYLYNVATKKYLCASGNWDTHAALENVPGHQLKVTLTNGYYRLATNIRGNAALCLGLDGTDPWMDKDPARYDCDFTIEEAQADGYEQAYYLKHSRGYLTGGTDHLVTFDGTAGSNAVWVLLSLDDLNDAMLAAVPADGVEATHLIANPGFQLSSHVTSDKWVMTATTNDTSRGRSWFKGQTQEFWNNTFDIYQQLTAVPNGRYGLTVQGFNRINNDENATSPNDGYYYANNSEANLMPIGTHATQYTGDYASGGKWATHSQAGAGDYMLDGGYQNAVLKVDVTDGMLKIGAKRTAQTGVCWTVLDNFQLTFFGNEPILQELINKAKKELLPTLDDTNAATLQEAIDEAEALLASEADQSSVEDMIARLQSTYNACDALNIAKQRATDVLNQVPYALFPPNFNWDEPTETVLDKNGKEVTQPVTGMSGADYNRQFKVYKNNNGKYQLASRLAVAALARLLEFADADEKAQDEIREELAALEERHPDDVFTSDFEAMLAEMLDYYSRLVVESHGVGMALFEQGDEHYSQMYDAVTGNRYGIAHDDLGWYWLDYYGIDIREFNGFDVTLSDTYKMLNEYLANYLTGYGSSNSNYKLQYLGFDANLTAHITDPNLLDGGDAWENDGFEPDEGESLTNAAATIGLDNTEYPYFTLFGNGKADAHQTITLPAGRYMLTVAGRAAKASLTNKTATTDSGIVSGTSIEGPFTEASATINNRYFQLYATNSNGETRAQSIVPQVGNGEADGVFGYGWNDASLYFTMPSIGTVTLGVRAETDVEGAEASFTRLRLTRLGDATLYFDEYVTYDTELNWDATNYHFNTAPTDVVLHKKMEAGKWYSIALPVDVSADQLTAQFGYGTRLAVPSAAGILDSETKELLVNFESWDVAAQNSGPISTKYTAEYYLSFWGYNFPMGNYEYENPAGIIANVPYLIKPAQVKADNMYTFYNVRSSETSGSKVETPEDGTWSWGGFTLSTDEEGYLEFNAYDEVDNLPDIKFVPNYTYNKEFADGYTIEFDNQQKAFTAQFVCADDWTVGLALLDGGVEILGDQLNSMLALGESQKDLYPGIPTAMSNLMTTNPRVTTITGKRAVQTVYNRGEFIADDTWQSIDGKIKVTGPFDSNSAGLYDEYGYATYPDGKYTISTSGEGSIVAYAFIPASLDGDSKMVDAAGNEYEFPAGNNFDFDNVAIVNGLETESTWFEVSSEGTLISFPYVFYVEYEDGVDFSTNDIYLIHDALQNVRNAVSEAKKAYPLSNEFHAVYAEAEALLDSEHTDLVAGADATFRRIIAAYLTRFNRLTTAAGIAELTEALREEIAKYLTQIDRGLVTTGKYVLLNEGSGKYLGGGNRWGTQATLTEHGELMDLTLLDNGKYRLETRFRNQGDDAQVYFGLNGYYYMDNPVSRAAELDITPLGGGLFTIGVDGKLLGSDGESTELASNLTDGSKADAQWRILSAEDLLALLAEAIVDEPADATFLLKDPNFSRNHRDQNAWTFEYDAERGNCRLGATSQDDEQGGFNCASEAWISTFTLSQTAEVPNGVYVLEAQAAITDYDGAYDGVDYPVVFANNETSPFVDMEVGDRATTMLQIERAFAEGRYTIDPIVVEVTDGKLTVGARCEKYNFWSIWDNFSLKYFGEGVLADVQNLYTKSGSGQTNGIGIAETDKAGSLKVYTIDGHVVRTDGSLNGLKKGVYIVNGKKVVK